MTLTVWLRSRLGCAGAIRNGIQARLLASLPATAGHILSRYADDAVVDLLEQMRLPDTVLSLPGWSRRSRVVEVAGWGAALAAIGLPPRHSQGDRILREAAAFNLAIALFDTVVDETPVDLAVLAASLDRNCLADRLLRGTKLTLADPTRAPALQAIVQLFDYALGSMHDRLKANPEKSAELARLLGLMHDSELGLIADPFLAKTLPIVFIGRLANCDDHSEVDELFQFLARFIASWDDFLDLFADWRRGRANRYLWVPRLSLSFPFAGGLASGVYRVICGPRCTAALEAELMQALNGTFIAADKLGDSACTKRFLRRLIEGPS